MPIYPNKNEEAEALDGRDGLGFVWTTTLTPGKANANDLYHKNLARRNPT